jgi:dodecin
MAAIVLERSFDDHGPRSVGRARTAKGEVRMSVYRVIDVIGTSTTSWEDAAVTAVKTAGSSVRDIRVAEVVRQDLDLSGDGGEVTFRVKLQVSFKYEE